MSAPARGRFITLEGGEGVGKSTQVRALAAALRQRGLEVAESREPGGSTGAEAIRALLLGGAADRWGPQAEALLFAAARADHVEKTIRPALERGAWVICDRFVDSSIAYQGADGIGAEAILRLHAIGSGGLLPDRTLLLILPSTLAAMRQRLRDGGRMDRFGVKDEAYHLEVATTFRKLAQDDPDRWRVVTAEGEPEEVTARLLNLLDDLS